MKKTNAVFFTALLMLVALLAGQHTSNAARPGPGPLGIQSFGGEYVDGTNLEIVYVAKTGKLGVVIKSSEGEPIAAHLLQGVKDPRGTFELTGARKFGAADESSLTSINISDLTEDSLAVEVKGGSRVHSLKLARQQIMPVLEAGGGLKCDNYCRPSNPDNFNWWQCFWCCSTASGPCV